MPEIPNFEKFKSDIRRIYSDGDLAEAYTRLKWLYGNNEDFSNPDIYNLIITKFSEHVEAWKRKYGDREERYVSEASRKELKNIMTFLGGYMWRQEFKGLSQLKSRDKYLFPNKPIEELYEQLTQFKERNKKT